MKQGFLCQEMAGLEEVVECINDWRGQGCRFVYNIEGQIDGKSTLVHHFYTYGDLPKDMEKFSDADEELWKDNKEYMQLKSWWKSVYEKQPKKIVLRVYVVLKERAEMVCEALDKAKVMHGEIKNDGGFSPKRYNYYVEVPDKGGAHYLEELIHMNCKPELIEKFIIKEV